MTAFGKPPMLALDEVVAYNAKLAVSIGGAPILNFSASESERRWECAKRSAVYGWLKH